MKALQVIAPGQSRILDLPVPQPGPGQVLMRILAVTTCPQWDLHIRHNEPMFIGHQFHYPYAVGQPGHEAAGDIVAVGPGVTSIKPGDRVSAWKDAGHDRQGCYAQYVVHDADHVIKVPVDLPLEAVAPVELAMCVGSVFLMLQSMNGLSGRTVGVSGLGPAGLVAIQMARAEGAGRIIGFDLLAKRREQAMALGCDAVYDPTDCPLGARPGKLQLETAIDCVGAKSSVEFLMDRTEDIVALFGVQRSDYTYAPRHYSKLRLCGYQGHSRKAAEYAVELIKDRKLDLAPLVTHHLPLEAYDEGIGLLERQEGMKICFWPWQE